MDDSSLPWPSVLNPKPQSPDVLFPHLQACLGRRMGGAAARRRVDAEGEPPCSAFISRVV